MTDTTAAQEALRQIVNYFSPKDITPYVQERIDTIRAALGEAGTDKVQISREDAEKLLSAAWGLCGKGNYKTDDPARWVDVHDRLSAALQGQST